jgi:hypothetical protein
MSLEPSSSAPAGEVGAGYWAAREEAAARLEAMAAAARVDDDLSEEQFQGNSQIQEDEVTDGAIALISFSLPSFSSFQLIVKTFDSSWGRKSRKTAES